jgi:hypothetical protein
MSRWGLAEVDGLRCGSIEDSERPLDGDTQREVVRSMNACALGQWPTNFHVLRLQFDHASPASNVAGKLAAATTRPRLGGA